MCRFKSALVLRSGEIVQSEHTDSHEILIAWAGLRDDTRQPNFVRIEFVPSSPGKDAEIDGYTLKIDQDWTPPWWDEAMVADVTRRMRGLIERMIVRDERKILLGGQWILADGARIDTVIGARLVTMIGSSQVGAMRGSSQVGAMCDSSQVGATWDSSQVGKMCDSSQVGEMGDSSRVGAMWDSSRVGAMRDSSRVGTMWDSSRVGTMWDSSQVGAMRGSSQVGTMGPKAKAPRPPQKAGA